MPKPLLETALKLSYQLYPSTEETDTPSENKQPTLILIHGLFGDRDNLNSVRRGLQTQYQILNIDLRNHGDSPWSDSMSFNEMVADLALLINELNLEKVHILGHSLGGKVAMHYAVHYPEQVASLIIADIAPVTYESSHLTIFNALRALDLNNIQSRKDADQALAKDIKILGVRQFLLKNLRSSETSDLKPSWQWRMNLETLYTCYSNLIGSPFTEGQYSGPSIFIRGDQSNYILAEHEAVILKHFPAAQIKTVKGAGHWLHAERPKEFNQVVQAFLDENRS